MPIVPLSRSPSYLHECLALHNEVTRLRFGRAQDLSVVERAAARIRSSRRLIYDDVYAIAAAPEFGVGMVYWQWPTRTEVESALADQSLDLWNLPKNEKKTVGLLRTAFKSIEAASVLLRFIVPEHYGILSAPVERVLGVRAATSAVDKYLGYVSDLRMIRNECRFETAAQVDMALWALQVGVLGELIKDSNHLKKAFGRDQLLREIRVRNLAQPLFDEMERLDLVEALVRTKPDVAGQLAALEFERAARQFANASPKDDLSAIIDKSAPAHKKGPWQHGRQLRNRAVHGEPLQPREIENLIALAREVMGLRSAKRGTK